MKFPVKELRCRFIVMLPATRALPIWALCLSLVLPQMASAGPMTFYVSTQGNDAWSGRLAEPNASGTDGPLASLAAARDAVRKSKAAGPLAAPIDVVIRGGTYYLDKSLDLTAEDSGTEACPITYRAQAGERPILSGGVRLTEWKPYRENIFCCGIPAERFGPRMPKQLFYRSVRQELARYPNRDPKNRRTGGFLYMNEPVKENTTWVFTCSGDVLPHKFAHPEDVEAYYFDGTGYSNMIVPLADVLHDGRLATLGFPAPEPYTNSGNRFYVRNALEELDAPGEWYYDKRTGTLYFWPPDEDLLREGAVVPRVADLIVCRGDFDKQQFVEHVAFDHLGLECSHDDGIVLETAQRCRVVGCTLVNIGRTAIFLGEGSRACRVAGNDISYPGGHAVATAPGVGTPKETADHVITNNYAHHCGEIWVCSRQFGSWGSGFFLNGRRHTLSHNWIHDVPYNPINFAGFDNIIEFNHCHDGVLECFDGAGIYGWIDPKGGSSGNIVRFNKIHDIVGYGIPWIANPKIPEAFKSPFGAWGIYLDNELCGTMVEGNLVYRTPGNVLHHGGWDTKFEHNIFAEGSDEQIVFSNMLPDVHAALQKTPEASLPMSMSNNLFQRNIVYFTGAKDSAFYGASWLKNVGTFRENIVYHGGRPVKVRIEPHTKPASEISWDEWLAMGQDAGTQVVDPRFVDPAKDDYRLQADSPALALGFAPDAAGKAGLYEDPERASWPAGAMKKP